MAGRNHTIPPATMSFHSVSITHPTDSPIPQPWLNPTPKGSIVLVEFGSVSLTHVQPHASPLVNEHVKVAERRTAKFHTNSP